MSTPRLGNELGVEFGDQVRHLFLEGVAVVFDFHGADVAAARKNEAVSGDLGCRGGLHEARHVGVFVGAFVTAPCVVSTDDFLKIGVRQLAVDTVDEGAEFAGIDEEGLLAVEPVPSGCQPRDRHHRAQGEKLE